MNRPEIVELVVDILTEYGPKLPKGAKKELAEVLVIELDGHGALNLEDERADVSGIDSLFDPYE